MPERKRILFVGEGVTLAHVARPVAFASTLNPLEFDVRVACDERYRNIVEDEGLDWTSIHTVSSQDFLEALQKGQLVYTREVLNRYIEDDLRLLHESKPDVVVGDFRLSLQVSARRAQIPYASICNAYWSPWTQVDYELPSHSITKYIGLNAASAIFRVLQPAFFKSHTRTIDEMRRAANLEPVGTKLGLAYMEADFVLFPDVPELVPTVDVPADRHCYVGPAEWSPKMDLPEWWDRVPSGKPIVYVTMGSSGDKAILPKVLEALVGQDYSILVATAGVDAGSLPANFFCAPYLPGRDAARRASVVISNGGSPTTYQALAQGAPLVGIPGNMDQHLCMNQVRKFGAAISIRSDQLSTEAVRNGVAKAITDPSLRAAAQKLQHIFAKTLAERRLEKALRDLSDHKTGASHPGGVAA